jgi:hypothetical protein
MIITEEFARKIDRALVDYPEIRNGVLEGNSDSIREMIILYDRGIRPEDVIRWNEEGTPEKAILENMAKELLMPPIIMGG